MDPVLTQGKHELGLFNARELSGIIGQIYDCAVDPALWVRALSTIRDRMDMAYVHINFMDQTFYMEGANTQPGVFQSEWDQTWIEKLPRFLPLIPGIERWAALEVDE